MDNLRARTVSTQIGVLQHIVVAVIVAIGLAAILMTFDRVRQLGAAVLASAGIAGIVLGFAAQKTLGNLIAGLQIAFTQPLRIGDTVVVQKRVRPDRGDHPDLRRRETLGPQKPDRAHHLLRREPVPELDPPHDRPARHGFPLCGLHGAGGGRPGRVETHPGRRQSVGSQSGPAPGHQRHRADDGTARPRECGQRRRRVGPPLPRAERLIEFIQRRYPHALPRLRTQFEESENRRSDDA